MLGLFRKPDNSAYWQAIAERNKAEAKKWEDEAGKHWRRFTDACKECNAIEEELIDAKASIQRLTDALQAKNVRLERIAEHFECQSSGTAKLAARMARGEA
jgi:hypothetical protein